jgi:hypothetical protein
MSLFEGFIKKKSSLSAKGVAKLSLIYFHIFLLSVELSLEVEPQRQDASIKRAFETLFVRIFPFSVDDTKGNVFVRWARVESNEHGIGRLGILIDVVSGCY